MSTSAHLPGPERSDGVDADDVAWMLKHAAGETFVARPATARRRSPEQREPSGGTVMLRTARYVEERAAVEFGEVSIFLSAKYLHTPRASRIGRSPFG